MPKYNIFEFEEIGTHWWCEPLSGQIDTHLRTAILATGESFNASYSRFIDGSLVGQLNQGFEVDNPPRELLDMFAFAREMFEVSDGAFDITVGGPLHTLGYGSRKRAAPVRKDFWDTALISPERIQLPPHTTIDFGGFGKGWLIDRFVKLLLSSGVKEFIINGGGDLYVHSNSPVEIALEHPLDSELMIGKTRIQKGALGVSSPYKRAWKMNETTYHHIIDPSSELPVENEVASTYVRADTALIADTMASILLLRPDLNDELAKRYDLKTIIIKKAQLV